MGEGCEEQGWEQERGGCKAARWWCRVVMVWE